MNDLLGIKDPPTHHMLHRAAGLFDLNELDRVSREPGPKFVMMHVLLPHEPYVFAANGEYSGLSEADSKFSAAGLRDQLTFTNERIRGIVDGLLSGPEETRPIIIIAGDEGPYPDRYARDQNGFDWGTATDAELETKYGVLNALYLPGEAPAGRSRGLPRHDPHQHVPHRARPVLRRGHPAAPRPELHEREVGPALGPDGHHRPAPVSRTTTTG